MLRFLGLRRFIRRASSTNTTLLMAILLGSALLALSPVRVSAAEAAPPPDAVQVVRAPAGCFVPDVVVDRKGVLHMVYALNRNAYYLRSADNGGTFTEPVQVNSEGSVEFKMGERGPKLAVGSDDKFYIVTTAR
jgi:hypothetical protein